MTQMTVTRALAELKRIDDRIGKEINGSDFIAVGIGRGTNMTVYGKSGVSVEQVKSQIQSSFDSVQAMFSQRAAIKGAIVKSNATTLVKIGQSQMTVAEAIELKKSIVLKEALLHKLRQSFGLNNTVAVMNAKLDEIINASINTIYGADKSKIDSSTYESVAAPQKTNKEASLIDPLNVGAKLKTLEEEISVVHTELDYILSESNSVTFIEV